MVDGPVEERQAMCRLIPIELCRTSQRGLPAMESQCQSHERHRDHIKTEQRTGSAETITSEVQECLQEAFHSLCCSSLPESCRCRS